jgi:hypothetical protein
MKSATYAPRLSWPLGAALLLAGTLLAGSGASAQDRSVLEEHRAVNPDAKAPLAAPAGAVPRVLLAGDSWAQYMWDDGSHNDIFDRFGQADKLALSQSLSSDPGPGYTGTEYAISGSEARQWVDTANYPWIHNMVTALQQNPTIDYVMLSIDGNDILAGKSDGGWYKDMDLDVPGSEAALFDRIHQDTDAIIDSALAVRPNLQVLLSSYDYPNFNVGFWCFVYACPERRNLSRDPTNDLITDQEINQMMVTVEGERIDWVNADARVLYDNAVGLMHYFYGDGVSASRTLPRPGETPPGYLPFPGGNPLLPTLRSNFRQPNGIDADPIHLNYDGYQYKIANQTEFVFFPAFRGQPTATLFAAGGTEDGWTDGTVTGTEGVRVGDNGQVPVAGILTFDTSGIPDGATVENASIYILRKGAVGTDPFTSGALGTPVVDVATGTFGAAAVEPGDATATADAPDAGTVIGSARADGYAIRVDLDASGLAAINDQGLTQIRLSFPTASADTVADYVLFQDGDAGPPPTTGLPSVADVVGTAAPFLDVTYTVTTAVGEPGRVISGPRLYPNAPNPFSPATRLRFYLPEAGAATVRVYDVAGREVATLVDGPLAEGDHEVVWDGRDGAGRRLAAGMYLARLDAEGVTRAVRMVLAR